MIVCKMERHNKDGLIEGEGEGEEGRIRGETKQEKWSVLVD